MKVGQEPALQYLLEGCDKLGIDLAEEAIHKLKLYYAELLRWRKKINLIGKKQDPKQIIESHFLDSLMLLPHISNNGKTLVDVGSGAGFPGLVCKTALPALQLVLIEPRLKRVSFLRHIIRTLKLQDIEIYAKRIEEIPKGSLSGASFTSRAVAEIDEFLIMIQHLLSEDARVICMKGPKWEEEMTGAASSLRDFNLEVTQVNEFVLPFSSAKRAILCFHKIKHQ